MNGTARNRFPADWRRIVRTSVAIGIALPCLAHAACQIESIEMPVRMSGSRAVATVGIDGTEVPLTVDSGAFFSFLTDAAAAQLKLTLRPNNNLRIQGLTGRVETHLATVDKLQLFKGDIGRVQFIVGGNEPGAGTMGLMGRNILSFTDTEYDLAHGMIRFLFPGADCANSNLAYWAGSTPVTELDLLSDPSRNPSLRAEVKLNGHRFVAMFDSGATTTVSARAARRTDVAETDWKPFGTMTGAGRGVVKSFTASFDKFEIGGEVVSNNRLLVADITVENADMLLGIDFFLSHRIYVSKKQDKMFITYNGGPVFALDKAERTQAAAAGTTHDAADPRDQGMTAEQFARRGAASAARHDNDSALADLDRACALEPDSAAFLSQRGVILEALKRLAKARADFDRALELDPTQVDARFRRVGLRFAAKDRDGARSDLDALDAELAPQSSLRLSMAQFYMVLNQPAQAVAQLDAWLPGHPNEVQRDGAFHLRCSARLVLGTELDHALDDCDEAIDIDGKNAAYLETRGWVELRLAKDRKAAADFTRSLDIRPAGAAALYGRSLARTRLGDAAAGGEDLDAARKLQPGIERRMAVRSGIAVEATEAAARP